MVIKEYDIVPINSMIKCYDNNDKKNNIII